MITKNDIEILKLITNKESNSIIVTCKFLNLNVEDTVEIINQNDQTIFVSDFICSLNMSQEDSKEFANAMISAIEEFCDPLI